MKAPFSYRVLPDGGLFAVVCIHDGTPDWWHVVARFGSKDRAESYAEVENDMVNDAGLETEQGWYGDEKPAPVAELPAPPPAGVTPANFRPPSPAERARVGAALLGEAAAETGTAIEIRAEAGPVPPPVEEAPLRSTPKPRAPRPVSGNAERVWRAITAIRDEGREPMTGEIVERAGIPKGSLGAAKDTLYACGYIDCDETGIIVLIRPDDMPAPRGAVEAPPPKQPTPNTRPEVFTRAAALPPPPAAADFQPVEVGLRDVVRYLAKDIGLIVRGPDDEQSYVVDRQKGLQGPGLVEIANKWRARRKEPPFRLGA